MNIVFFGSSSYVIPILEILKTNFNLSLVLTTENPKSNLASQGDALRSYPVVKYCVKNKIPYLSLEQFNNIAIQQLNKSNAPVGILADFGLIIPKQVLDLFPKGIINIHPSLLPKYRGPTPVQTAILNGEKITGVSIMKLDEEVDHGPILGQEKKEILGDETSESLYKRLFEKGANLLLKILPDYLSGNLKPAPQNHEKATFTKPLTRQNGYVDLAKFEIRNSKLEIDRMIRAYYPWPGTWTELRIKNHESRIKFLPDKKIQVEGKKVVSYKDFLNGYPELKQQLEKLVGPLV